MVVTKWQNNFLRASKNIQSFLLSYPVKQNKHLKSFVDIIVVSIFLYRFRLQIFDNL